MTASLCLQNLPMLSRSPRSILQSRVSLLPTPALGHSAATAVVGRLLGRCRAIRRVQQHRFRGPQSRAGPGVDLTRRKDHTDPRDPSQRQPKVRIAFKRIIERSRFLFPNASAMLKCDVPALKKPCCPRLNILGTPGNTKLGNVVCMPMT